MQGLAIASLAADMHLGLYKPLTVIWAGFQTVRDQPLYYIYYEIVNEAQKVKYKM